jgi:hypothetical protein
MNIQKGNIYNPLVLFRNMGENQEEIPSVSEMRGFLNEDDEDVEESATELLKKLREEDDERLNEIIEEL